MLTMMDTCQVLHEPLGVVLIIGAWNYPFNLVLAGLVGAIAAGNAVVLKPSEVAPHSAQALAEAVRTYLDPACVKVINGGVAETTRLLEQRFDHILYTGNPIVGKIVMTAAAKHLCPVTLELGGKSPCIVDADSDMTVVGRRIAWGRFVNAGQTCVAPDYILALPGVEDRLVAAIEAAVREYYGDDPKASPHYGRIVNKGTPLHDPGPRMRPSRRRGREWTTLNLWCMCGGVARPVCACARTLHFCSTQATLTASVA